MKGAHLAGAPVFAIKVASGFYGNTAKGLATGSGLVLVFDASTGFPIGLLLDVAELGEIVTGRKPGREARQMIICDLTGVGAQDAAIAEAAWRKLIGT